MVTEKIAMRAGRGYNNLDHMDIFLKFYFIL